MEIGKSSAEVKNHIHECLREYASTFMNANQVFSLLIEESGRVIAGASAESVSDTLEAGYLYAGKRQ